MTSESSPTPAAVAKGTTANLPLSKRIGTEHMFDLRSAVREPLWGGTIWLEHASVENLGLDWYAYSHSFEDYACVELNPERGRMSMSAEWSKELPSAPLQQFITYVDYNATRPFAEWKNELKRGVKVSRRWIVVPAGFDVGEVRVRSYTHRELLALRVDEWLQGYCEGMKFREGLTVLPEEPDDPWPKWHVMHTAASYRFFQEEMPSPPRSSQYNAGKLLCADPEAPKYVAELARLQEKKGWKDGVRVYSTDELASHVERLEVFVDRLLTEPSLDPACDKLIP